MQNTNKTLVIVDLDGTLYSINTFEAWILFYLKESLKAGRWRVAALLIWFGVLRKLRLISHEMLKRKVIKLSIGAHENVLDGFIRLLEQYQNKCVIAAFRAIDARTNILATAAPDFYASKLSGNADFQMKVMTSSLIGSGWADCRGREKVTQVTQHVDLGAFDEIIFFTDHFDDIPLMKISSRVVLVSPSKKTTRLVELEGLTYSVL